MEKILPQANTLATVIRTFKFIGNCTNCSLDDIADFNQFRKRQASYYTSACHYLDLIDEKMKLTSLGEDIMRTPKNARVKIYEVIIKHELIGQIFAKTALYSKRVAFNESKKIVKRLYPEYGEAVIDRRTKCLIGWCEEIIKYMRESI